MAIKKIPPPPPVAIKDPVINRWFVELTAFLTPSGTIDGGDVAGLPELTADVATLTTQVTTLSGQVATLAGQVATLQTSVTALQTSVTALQASVAALQARAQVLNGTVDPAAGLGNVGDWYANTSGAAGHRIFVKTASATWTAFPF